MKFSWLTSPLLPALCLCIACLTQPLHAQPSEPPARSSDKKSVIIKEDIGGLRVELQQTKMLIGEAGDPNEQWLTLINSIRFRDVRTQVVYGVKYLPWGENPPSCDPDILSKVSFRSPGEGSWIMLPLPCSLGVYFEPAATFPDSVRTLRPKGFLFHIDPPNGPAYFQSFVSWKDDSHAVLNVGCCGTFYDVTLDLNARKVDGLRYDKENVKFDSCKGLFLKIRAPSSLSSSATAK